MSETTTQPDWDSIAEKFDHWVPHMAPVSNTLIDALQPEPGQRILDIACGTGEPALTLARRMPQHINITATDAAEGMVKAAEKKAQREKLHNIQFHCMPAESLDFEDNSFDGALSRFGIMLFNEPQLGLQEIYRVLKPGARFAFAVWSTPETMTTLQWSNKAFSGLIPDDAMPPVEMASRFGSPSLFNEILSLADITDVKIQAEQLIYYFDSFDQYWETALASDIMKMQLDALNNPQDREIVYQRMKQLANEFVSESGLTIPLEYLLAYGKKS